MSHSSSERFNDLFICEGSNKPVQTKTTRQFQMHCNIYGTLHKNFIYVRAVYRSCPIIINILRSHKKNLYIELKLFKIWPSCINTQFPAIFPVLTRRLRCFNRPKATSFQTPFDQRELKKDKGTRTRNYDCSIVETGLLRCVFEFLSFQNTTCGHGFVLVNLTGHVKSFRSGLLQFNIKFNGIMLLNGSMHLGSSIHTSKILR